jgi:hypothetical protein
MQRLREHAITRIVEELEPLRPMTELNRRLLGFKRAGVLEYWSVDAEAQQIFVYRLNDLAAQGNLPADWKETVAEFFAAAPRLPRGPASQTWADE